MPVARLTSVTERRTSLRHRRRRSNRGGFTLVESMIASSLLAASVVGVSGTILASYDNDQQSISQRDATVAAESLMDELTALPFESATATDVSLSDFASYSDTSQSGQATVASAKVNEQKGGLLGTVVGGVVGTVGNVVGGIVGLIGGLLGGGSSGGGSGSGSSSATPTAMTITPSNTNTTLSQNTVNRVVSVVRSDTLNGPSSPTGRFALVTVDAALSNGQTVRIRRLVTSTEAGSAAAAASR